MSSAAGEAEEWPDVRVVAVMGPTASGKTWSAVALARALDGELVNADSRQAIAELSVGVCKPTSEDLQGVPCHGLDWGHLGRRFTVVDYVPMARTAVEAIAGRGRVAVVVGGTGLYLRSLLQGFDFGGLRPGPGCAVMATPATSDDDLSAHPLAELRDLDPERASTVDAKNPRRVARALELARRGARPGQLSPGWRSRKLALRVDAGRLRARIEARSERLVGDGLALEVESLLRHGYSAPVLAGCAIGYAEVLDWLSGRCQRVEAVERVVLRTWRYARAQMTWLRSEVDLVWIDADASPDEVLGQCLAAVGEIAA
ncbi:MAG TPA: tRNA (adenosine(37)-N6)-dimethylallyltransferase MiaA [Candidatus Dormibacteraeota bacterium]|nr:tRNA (adenosine(37)-N6)-dimethylallyltransferase MiaA [Candidatus Dormibacteraeota bacterium]HVC22890.1 tRNA (adenosine(37)-N6)-dimethylallyltransferase MiaA [Candidatus Dormibacteraeota bacterium]